MKLTIVKQLNNTFKVAYDSGYEKMKRIKVGDFLECEIRKPRNYMFHKKFFSLINLLYQNQEIYVNINDLREDLIITAGYYRNTVNFKGETVKRPISISFANMDEHEFNDLYNAVIDVIVKCFNFDKQDIIDNVEQYY